MLKVLNSLYGSSLGKLELFASTYISWFVIVHKNIIFCLYPERKVIVLNSEMWIIEKVIYFITILTCRVD